MKRSEMLDLIEAELYMIANTRGYTQKLLKAVANSILNMQEEAGMAPPMYYKNIESGEVFYDMTIGPDGPFHLFLDWEPEDEEK